MKPAFFNFLALTGLITSFAFPNTAANAAPPQQVRTVPITVFVRPGGTSYSFTIPTDGPGAALQDVGFQNVTAFSWNLTRAGIQSSTDGGTNWTPYTIQNNSISAFLPVSGRIFRVVDTTPGDTTTSNSFGNSWHTVAAPGSISSSGGNVIPDNAPTDMTADRTTVFDTLPQGSTLATVTPVDTGAGTGGWWVLESQSVSNLFDISFNRTVNNTVALTMGTGTMPALGTTVTAKLRYYDLYQTDGSGNPVSGQGFSKQFSFIVTPEVSNALTLGNDIPVNTFTTNNQSAPAVAALTTGNLAVVWQSTSQGGKSPATNSGIYGQLLTSSGAASGSEFVISNAGAAVDEIAPAVTALASGRYVVAYSKNSGSDYDIAYRIVEANGTVGSQLIANSTTAGTQSAPAITTLTDGSFVIAWHSDNGEIRARQFAAAAGAPVAGEVLFDSSGSNASVAGLSNASYVVAWIDYNTGEIKSKVSGGSTVGTGIISSFFVAPRLAGLSGGGFVLASESYNSVSTQSQIDVARYNNSGTLQGAKFQANTITTGNRYAASLAALTGGGFVVGWMADNGDFDLNGVFGRRYTSTGTAVDATEFEINQHRSGDQSYPAMTAMPSDTFATVWTDVTSATIAAGKYDGDIEARILVPPPVPTVTGISPTSGSTAGGTSVTISGTGFTGASAVSIGGTAVTSFTVTNATTISATTAARAAGAGLSVLVTTPGGTNTANTLYTYLTPPVAVADGVSPLYATPVNQQFVRNAPGVLGNDTLNGGSISSYGATTGAEQTTLGTATPTAHGGSIVLRADGSFTYTPQAVFSGNDTFKYTLTNGGGSSTATVTIYVDVLPTVATTVPANNATGVNLASPITINFSESISTFNTFTVTDTTAASSVSFTQSPTDGNSATAFTLTPTSALAAGHTITVTVSHNQTADADGGLSMQSDYVFSFTTLPAPVAVNDPDTQGNRYQAISGVTFDSALVGTPSSILANDTVSGGSMTYGATGPTSSTAVDGTTTITTSGGATVLLRVNGTFTYNPAPGFTGNDNFFYNVTNTSGSSRAQVLFKVNPPPPTVTSISPTAGPTAGGTTVIVTGTNFTGVSAVTFGATAATGFTFNSATSITATSPAGTGTVDIRITTPGGTSTTSAADQFTFVAAPTVTSLSPTAGPTTGLTSVVITGTNLTGATAVKFGATTATGFTVNSATQITATSPAGTGTVDVTITTVGGTSATSAADQYTFVPAPTVTSISPTAGPATGGTTVTITGSNFSGASAVTFGATAATGFTVNSATSITATSPAGTGTVDVRVTTVGGTSATSAADQFTFVPAPTVTSLSPTAGPIAGTTSVTITGANFTGASAVTFGATAATGFAVNSATQITATAPAGTGTVDVRITTTGGTSATSAADQYTYVAVPTVTSISPTAGPTAGLTTVVITGTNLTGATAVKFGATSATGFTVNSATQITATSPAGTGTVDVTVTTVGGISATSAADQFTFVPAPTVTSLSPTVGPATGGTTVTITGSNFSGASAVTFGATAATGFTVNSTTSITATSPAGTGTVDVRVTTVGGTSATSAADQFTFVPAPTVTSISPTAGPTAGTTSVTITGTNFTGASAVTFGATAATGFTVNSATSITATSPAGTGTVDVRVTTVGGTSATSAADQFTYVPKPVVTSISPVSGPTIGGTSVTITGSNFSGASAVKFGATAATGFTVNSATQITATSPAGTGGVDITVTTVGGTSDTSAADVFTFTTANHFTVTAPGTAAAGTAFNVTVTALDSFNNLASGYTGTVHFTSSDGNALLHADTTLTSGAGTFSTTLENAGSQTVTVTDTVSSGITGTSGSITVSEAITLVATDASASVGVVDTGTYRFTRGGNGAAVTVNFSLNGASTASTAEFTLSGSGVSFSGSTGTAIIPAGSTSVDVTLTAAANATNISKPSKTVQLDVATSSAYSVGSPANGTVTIAQNGFVVFNTSDSGQGSLRQAVFNANALGGAPTITFDSVFFGTPQTITLTTGQLDISASQMIQGPGEGLLTVSGNSSSRVFQIDVGQTASLSGMTITGGNGVGTVGSNKGGGIYNVGTLSVTNCRVTGNATPAGEGGGIDNAGPQMTLTNCQIDSNTASYSGGGIISRTGILTITSCTVANNAVTGTTNGAGGGIESDGPTLTITNSTFSGNHADNSGQNSGGGIYCGAGTATIISSTITGNSAKSSGSAGGVCNYGATAVIIKDTIVASNTGTSSSNADVSGAFNTSSYNLIGDGTGGSGLTNGTNGNIVGTGVSPIDPKLGALANNGGMTLTHLLLSGSPAINAGSNALLPADTYDLDGDSDLLEVLPVDQRGVGFPRIQGPIVDIGAIEGLIYTPALTATTTNEDVQSSSGLVITANSADAGGTTNYQITAVTGGTLYKSDGSTTIASNDFITKAEGAAGLKFTPSANEFSPSTTFGFSVQAAISANVSDLKDAVVPATITVNPVADTPSVTNTSTTVNVQSVSGLVITRNAVDGAEVGFFKITNILHGTLYLNDGTTAINAGDFITVAQGGAGLKFISALNYTGVASFDVQGSVDSAGTGLGSGIATAIIAVGTLNPTAAQLVPTDPVTGLPLPPGSSYPVVSQSGTYEVRMSITNTTAFPLNGFRLSVDYSAYLIAQPSLRLYNSSSAPGVVPAFIDYPFPVAVGDTVSMKLQFYTSTRRMPNPFNPTLAVTALAASEVSSTNSSGVQPRINVRPNGTVLLEWDSVPGTWYRVKYSADLVNWYDSPVPVQANANRTQWLDDGAPFTNVSPATVPRRYYLVNSIAAPIP